MYVQQTQQQYTKSGCAGLSVYGSRFSAFSSLLSLHGQTFSSSCLSLLWLLSEILLYTYTTAQRLNDPRNYSSRDHFIAWEPCSMTQDAHTAPPPFRICCRNHTTVQVSTFRLGPFSSPPLPPPTLLARPSASVFRLDLPSSTP